MNENIKTCLVGLSFLLFILVSLPALFFIRNAKKENAKIITDKLSIYSIFIIAFIFIGFLINFALAIVTMRNSQITTYMLAFLLLSASFNMVSSQNIFAISQYKLLVNNNQYDIAKLQIKSIKKCFYHRILIKANNRILLRLTEDNFKKYQAFFRQKLN